MIDTTSPAEGKFKMQKKTSCFFILLISVLCISFLSSCGSKETKPEVTTFKLNEDGTVQQTIIGDLTDGTTVSGLKDYINELIADYTKGEDEAPAVVLESITEMGGDAADIVLSYASIDDYASFNNIDAFVGSIEEAYQKGYHFEKSFVTENKTNISGYMLPAEYPELSVLVLREAMNVILPEKAVIVSDDIAFNDDGSYSISRSVRDDIPEVFQSVNNNCSYIVFKQTVSEK